MNKNSYNLLGIFVNILFVSNAVVNRRSIKQQLTPPLPNLSLYICTSELPPSHKKIFSVGVLGLFFLLEYFFFREMELSRKKLCALWGSAVQRSCDGEHV